MNLVEPPVDVTKTETTFLSLSQTPTPGERQGARQGNVRHVIIKDCRWQII